MKNNSIFKSTLLIIAVFCTYITSAQTTHTIVLTCDTTNIKQENVNDVCSFGQDRGVSNEEYTLDVRVGDIVVWRGIANNSVGSSRIEIKEVLHKDGTNVFDESKLRDVNGIVVGVVQKGEDGDEEKYDLKFKVFNEDGRQNLIIDPKLRVR